jgi:hypothetical protein
MDERDKSNLEFLLSASPDILQDWYDKMNADDHQYARELLEISQMELDLRILELIDDVDHVDDAHQLLQQFTIAGGK